MIVFVYYVYDLECYGVVEFDKLFCVLLIEEKFVKLCLNYVVMGLYFYDNCVCDIVVDIKLLLCGELEIIDVNLCYFDSGVLNVEIMGCGYVWFDMGMYDLLIEVVSFIVML